MKPIIDIVTIIKEYADIDLEPEGCASIEKAEADIAGIPVEAFRPDVKFLDRNAVSGRHLIALYNRLMDAPAMKEAFPDENKRSKHILDKQLYGITRDVTCDTLIRAGLYDNMHHIGNIRVNGDDCDYNDINFDIVL